jgi:hypothetical protein
VSEIDAVYARVVACANAVLQGTRTPYEGAKELWLLSSEVDRLADALRAFVALASEWEEDPENRIAYENDIRIEAERLRRRLTN